MKKIFFLILLVFILTACDATHGIDFRVGIYTIEWNYNEQGTYDDEQLIVSGVDDLDLYVSNHDRFHFSLDSYDESFFENQQILIITKYVFNQTDFKINEFSIIDGFAYIGCVYTLTADVEMSQKSIWIIVKDEEKITDFVFDLYHV